jgi:hypothetical protein
MHNGSYLTNRRRDGHPHRLKDLAADAPTFATDSQMLSIFFYGDLLQRFEIPLDIRPFEAVACLLQAPIQFLAQHQSQETAKNMAANRLIHLMVYGPGYQNRLDIPENLLDLPQLLVFESHPVGRQIGGGLQDPFAVKPGIFLDLLRVDPDVIPVYLQVLAIPPIPDERLGISLQLFLQGLNKGLTVLRVFAGLSGIQTDQVTTWRGEGSWVDSPSGRTSRKRPPRERTSSRTSFTRRIRAPRI